MLLLLLVSLIKPEWDVRLLHTVRGDREGGREGVGEGVSEWGSEGATKHRATLNSCAAARGAQSKGGTIPREQ